MGKLLFQVFVVGFCVVSVGYWVYLLTTLKFLQG